MPMRFPCCVVATLALACPIVHAEHIELSVSLSTVPGDIVATLGGAVATVVFDTSEAPIEIDLQSVTFAGVVGTLDAALYSVDDNESPSIASPSLNRLAGPIDSATLTYSQAGNRNMSVTLTKGDATLSARHSLLSDLDVLSEDATDGQLVVSESAYLTAVENAAPVFIRQAIDELQR